jgi:predicted flap endonuclease-1-like 5' DNA nuclease
MGEDRSRELTRTLGELFEGLRDSRLETLGELDQIQTMSRVLLQYEARRIDERFGEDHPRSRSVQASLEQNLDNIKGIELELEIYGIEVAEVEENQTLIHGRVVDERSRGVGGLFVTISDEEGRALTPFGRAETDASGYYALVVDPDALERVSEAAREGVFLTVRTGRGEIVHQEFDPLTVAEGDRKTAEVVLRREDLIGDRRQTEYRRETGYEPSGATEEPELEDVWGIGPKRADLLRRAGITSVRALSEAQDERLKDILGDIDVQKIKQDSVAVLGQARG